MIRIITLWLFHSINEKPVFILIVRLYFVVTYKYSCIEGPRKLYSFVLRSKNNYDFHLSLLQGQVISLFLPVRLAKVAGS